LARQLLSGLGTAIAKRRWHGSCLPPIAAAADAVYRQRRQFLAPLSAKNRKI